MSELDCCNVNLGSKRKPWPDMFAVWKKFLIFHISEEREYRRSRERVTDNGQDSLFIYYKQTEHEIANVGRLVSWAKVPSNPKFSGHPVHRARAEEWIEMSWKWGWKRRVCDGLCPCCSCYCCCAAPEEWIVKCLWSSCVHKFWLELVFQVILWLAFDMSRWNSLTSMSEGLF